MDEKYVLLEAISEGKMMQTSLSSHCIDPLPQLPGDPLTGQVTACLTSAKTPGVAADHPFAHCPPGSELCLHTGSQVGHQKVSGTSGQASRTGI